ncbi:Atp-dependent rna helicase [Thalictrum thalictroides]|uniref:Atp-dependent rna helicase n=1 Tax=Thalictrum thalictroides TaxID=46969 RepID=A0A7J6UXW6_THATH|nr:Atp-dependent rna helicase [Thalictrum thalictroides]
MSSYIPPHLRSSSSLQQTRPTSRSTITETLETDQSKLFYSSSSVFNAATTRRTYSSSSNPSSSRDIPPIEPVFEQWKPSERVFRLKPEQIEEVRSRLNVDVTVTSGSAPAPAPIESFADMCLHSSIMKDIAFHEYTRPTSIQAQAMPVALSGKDLLGCAETGSGKTAAFTIPMIQHCLAQPPIRRGDGPLALVLAPTRELAQQIEKEVITHPFGKCFLAVIDVYLALVDNCS